MENIRLDEALVARKLAESRSQALRFIKEGKVLLNGSLAQKASKSVSPGDYLELLVPQKYVSRAGEKLEGYAALHPFPIEGKTCIDIGASTGGFTDFLLQNGASHVTCVDVGHGQLHPKVASDPRVFNLEKTNAKALSPENLPYPAYDLLVIDVSFISLTKLLESLWTLLIPGGLLIMLIKPQFELTKDILDSQGGVIREEKYLQQAIDSVRSFASELPNAREIGFSASPIKGTDGNQEFLLGLRKQV